VSRRGDHFDAIERPLAVTGLPVVRAERALDPQVLDRGAGFLNGHVPVTGILSAIASRPPSPLAGTRWSCPTSGRRRPPTGGRCRAVNHQYSKSLDFEARFARVLEENLGGRFTYFSLLRSKSELWVAERFAASEYHRSSVAATALFRSTGAPTRHWCGECDKCCFIDLVLAPFLEPPHCGIFDGNEPLENSSLEHRFATLLGISESTSRSSASAMWVSAVRRSPDGGAADRAGEPVLSKLRAALARVVGDMGRHVVVLRAARDRPGPPRLPPGPT